MAIDLDRYGIPVIGQDSLDGVFNILSSGRELIQREPNAMLGRPSGIGVLVSEERHEEHRDSGFCCLQETVVAAVSDEEFRLRVD